MTAGMGGGQAEGNGMPGAGCGGELRGKEALGRMDGDVTRTTCLIIYLPLFRYQTQAGLTIASALISCCLGVGNRRKAVLINMSHIFGDPLLSAGGWTRVRALPSWDYDHTTSSQQSWNSCSGLLTLSDSLAVIPKVLEAG